jgi:hypothetical protein
MGDYLRIARAYLRWPAAAAWCVAFLGLAFLRDITLCWLGGILMLAISAVLWAPELLQVKDLLLLVLCTAVGQLCAYALAIWPWKRGIVINIACACCAFMVIESWILFFVMNGSVGARVNLAIAMVLAAASVATIALAYRRWCRADLDGSLSC